MRFFIVIAYTNAPKLTPHLFLFIRMKKGYSKAFFSELTLFHAPILQKKHIYLLICALIVGGELMHCKEEEDEYWANDEDEDFWGDEE